MCRTLWHTFKGQMEEEEPQETEKRVARQTRTSGRNNAT